MERRYIPTREENVNRLASGEVFDILVIGGGATGAGVAMDAATRGLTVACVEQEDFASGTSSRSTKLLWAGSRYLVIALVKLFHPKALLDPSKTISDFWGTFKMVLGCHQERRYMLSLNKHITNWLPIVVPLDSYVLWPPPFDYWPAAIGPLIGMFPAFFKFYDLLGWFCSPSSFVMFPGRAYNTFPQLSARRGKDMKYATVFYEGQHNDSRTNVSIALTAALKGAAISNYVECVGFTYDTDGKAEGAHLRDKLTGQEIKLRAREIIFAAGPYTDGVRKLTSEYDPGFHTKKEDDPNFKKVVKGAGGTHIVLPGYITPPHMGMVDMQTSRGSFMFVLPWEGHTLIGTTDSFCKNPTLHITPPEDEIQYLLCEADKYFTQKLRLRRSDVLSAWHGIRPLAVDPNATSASAASRDHTISVSPKTGITFIGGGKWTTWREMGEDVLNKVVAKAKEDADTIGVNRGEKRSRFAKATECRTLDFPLIGAAPNEEAPDGWDPNLAIELTQKHGLELDIARYLARNYGSRSFDVLKILDDGRRTKHESRINHASQNVTMERLCKNFPYTDVEVRYACRHEYARTPADILCRRTRLGYLNIAEAYKALARVCEIMAEELKWSDGEKERQVLETKHILDTDFIGSSANKIGTRMRAATRGDIKDAFVTLGYQGEYFEASSDVIRKLAQQLGFVLTPGECENALRQLRSYEIARRGSDKQ